MTMCPRQVSPLPTLWTLNEPVGQDALISVLSRATKTSSGFITKQKRDALRMLHIPKTMFMFGLKQGVGFAPVPGSLSGITGEDGGRVSQRSIMRYFLEFLRGFMAVKFRERHGADALSE